MDESMIYKTAFETIRESTEWGIESEDKAYGQFVDGVIAMSDAILNEIKPENISIGRHD